MAVSALANRLPDGLVEVAIQTLAAPGRMYIARMSWAFDRIRPIVGLVDILMDEWTAPAAARNSLSIRKCLADECVSGNVSMVPTK